MRPFKFLAQNKRYSLYREMVNECIIESLRWNQGFIHTVKTFMEDETEKRIRVTDLLILWDTVEINYQIELVEIGARCVGQFIVPYDEYMEMVRDVEPYHSFPSRV